MLLAALLVAGCSGIPGGGPVQDVSKPTDQVNPQAPVTPDAGMTPEAIVRGFIYAAARISLAGSRASAYAAPSQYLTARAAQTWQSKPSSVVVLPDQFRIDPSPTDPTALTIFAPIQGRLDPDKAYHLSYGIDYKVTVHLVKDNGQWRIADPPAELLIRHVDFSSVFSVRTLYFLNADQSVVVPDRRYLINGGTPDNKVRTLINLLLQGPAGVLDGAAQSELTGGSLRTNPTTDASGVTVVDLKGIDLPTTTDRNALAAQIVWTLSPDAGQISINVNGAPLDSHLLVYTASTVESFSPDRVPGTGAVASDPYFINDTGGVVDLLTKKALFGGVGTGSQYVVSAAMSAATGTLAAVSNVRNTQGGTGQQLLIGRPLAFQQSVPALQATTLTQPSFSRSGDEVWVVQNGGGKNPEIYQVSTSRTSSAGTGSGTGTASRAKVGSTGLAGKGQVTAFVLSPDGVRVAVVAGGKLYIGAIAGPLNGAKTGTTNSASTDDPNALTVTNLQELRGDLASVGPVAFQSANELMVVSASLPGYRSIKELKVDGSDLTQVTTDSQYGDVTSLAVSAVNSTATAPTDSSQTAPAWVYITLGQPGALGPVLKLQGSLSEGKWVSADPTVPMAASLFFPN